jgi:hypothetical protein
VTVVYGRRADLSGKNMVAVSVGTWNLENLFSGARLPRPRRCTSRSFAGIAATVTNRGIHVLAVQEIGDQQAFDDLMAALGAGWAGNL